MFSLDVSLPIHLPLSSFPHYSHCNHLSPLADLYFSLQTCIPTCIIVSQLSDLYLHLHPSIPARSCYLTMLVHFLRFVLSTSSRLLALMETLSAYTLLVFLAAFLTIPGVRAIYAIVCLMKMWVSASQSVITTPGIARDDLQIDSYLDRLIQLFRDIVSRDPQSPHGKFFYVAKRLKEKFIHIKWVAEQSEAEQSHRHKKPRSMDSQSSQSQSSGPLPDAPLRLLSEVAMNNSAPSQPQQQLMMAPQQQQQQQPQPQNLIQQHGQQTQDWYANAPLDPTGASGMMAQPIAYDPSFEIGGNYDFINLGNDFDLGLLFNPAPAAYYPFPTQDPSMGSMGGYPPF